jgi:amino acid adenylation domain-containing protein
VTAADDPRKATSDAFVVAVSDHGQHALWRADPALPSGWRRQSAAMSRRACLDAIAARWPDITPASVRAVAAGGPATGGTATGGTATGGPATGGTADGPVWPFVHEMVAEQATRRPEATAVMAAGTRLTYRELDQSANRLARYLAGLGAGPETVVGVHLDRGAEAIRGLLGIMKAGCGYLPLDPSLPPARLARMCAEARPVAILTDRADVKLPAGQARLVVTGAPELARQPATAPEVSLHPDHIGYAIYTSGSTGQPKAVAVSHGALACMIGEIAGEYQISAGDRVAQLAPLAFDTSIEQVLATLTRGATLMLPPPGTIAPTDLLRYLEREQVTVIDLTPAYWHQLLAITEPDDERLRSLRLMITGGDMADAADCRAARRAAPAARLLNAYGLTETTITSALADLSAPPEAGPVPVGRTIRHVRIMILDENLDPAPAGTTGEIYIGGRGVARGYLGRPALTAERFLPDPRGAGSRMYRTGDLGRWRADGQLEVSGRADRQLKVRGFRIEPGEIESALAAHPDIGQVAVVATGQGPGDQRLAAYYTLRRPGGRPPGAGDMRGFLRARLPGHMIPAAFIPLDQMPPAPEGAPALSTPGHPKVTAPAVVPGAVPGAVPGERRTATQAGMTYLWSKLARRPVSGGVVVTRSEAGDQGRPGAPRPERQEAAAA